MKNLKTFALCAFLLISIFSFTGCQLLFSILSGMEVSLPTPPADLTAKLSSDSQKITLSWQAGADASGYRIFYATENDTSKATYLIQVTETTYTFTPPVTNATLYFWVVSINGNGQSSASNVAYIEVLIKFPLIFDVTATTDDSISIAFSMANGAKSYYLMLGTSESNLYTEKTFTKPTFNDDKLCSYKITSLESGTKYYMQIKTYYEDEDAFFNTKIISYSTNKPYEYYVSEPLYANDYNSTTNGAQGRKLLYTRINKDGKTTISKNDGTYLKSTSSSNSIISQNPLLSLSGSDLAIKEEIDSEIQAILQEKGIRYPEEFPPARSPIVKLTEIPQLERRTVSSRANIGSTNEFYVEQANKLVILRKATVRATGRYCDVYVDDEVYSNTSTSDTDNRITSSQARAMQEKFDSLYLKMTNIFGELYSEQITGFIEPQSKVKIYVYDIYEDYSKSQSGGIYGYFWSKDLNDPDLYPEDYYPIYFSNQCPMFYIDSHFLDSDTDTMYSTLFHEFQHMLRFMNKNMPLGTKPDADGTWANEMMSMLAEELLQSDLGNADSNSPKSRLNIFFNGGYLLSGLNTWLDSTSNGTNMVLYSYANAYAFGTFLIRNYGGLNLVREMASNDKYNLEQITSAVRAMGYYTNLTDAQIIEELLLQFSRSLFYTDFAGTYSTSDAPKVWNKDFTESYGGYSYRITPILMSDYLTIADSSVYAGAIAYSAEPASLSALLPYTFQLHVWGEVTASSLTLDMLSRGSRKNEEVLYIIVK